jgi:hypothetical protein
MIDNNLEGLTAIELQHWGIYRLSRIFYTPIYGHM